MDTEYYCYCDVYIVQDGSALAVGVSGNLTVASVTVVGNLTVACVSVAGN